MIAASTGIYDNVANARTVNTQVPGTESGLEIQNEKDSLSQSCKEDDKDRAAEVSRQHSVSVTGPCPRLSIPMAGKEMHLSVLPASGTVLDIAQELIKLETIK